MRRYLMQQLMPVVAKAIVDVQTDQTDDPVKFVAQQLLVVSCSPDLAVTGVTATNAHHV